MSKTDSEKLQTLIDDLERSIASFDERFSKIPVEETIVPINPGLPARVFPTIDPEAERKQADSPEAAPAAPTRQMHATPLLNELAASAAQEAEHVRSEELRRKLATARIGRSLRLLSDYFDQLTQHLNLLKPALELDYAFDRQHRFTGIHWQDSTTRSESDNSSERSLPIKLVLRIRLTAAPLSMQVGDNVLRRIENELYLTNLAWRDAGIVDLPDKGIGHHIEVEGSIPVQLVFSADIDQCRIILRCRNLLGLGLSAYAVDPAAIDAPVMDQLGNCLLGRSKRLPDAFVPVAFNTPESAT